MTNYCDFCQLTTERTVTVFKTGNQVCQDCAVELKSALAQKQASYVPPFDRAQCSDPDCESCKPEAG